MNRSEFMETDVCLETTAHAMNHLISGKVDATPPNAHVAIALLSNVQHIGLAEEVLMSLADYLQRNPAVSDLIWEECLREVIEKTK